MVESPNDHADERTIGPSKAKLLGRAAFAAVVFVGATLLLLLGPHRSPGTAPRGMVLAVVLLISGVGIAALLAKRAFGGTVVTLSRTGFRDRRLSGDVVPWTAVTEVRVRGIRAARHIEVVTEPAFSRTFKGTLRHRLNATMGFPGLQIATTDLAISLDELLAAIDAHLKDAFATVPDEVGPRAPPVPKATGGHHAHQRIPFATISLMLVLTVVFAVEVIALPGEGAMTLTAATLARYGGVGKALVLDGQWWRLFTAPLLHGGPAHLVGNLVALGLGGTLLERRIGWRWFLACFGGGALAGAAATCLLDDPNVVSVGASGGITGLFAAVVVIAFALESGHERAQLLVLSLRLLLPTLIPSRAAGLAHVDVAAHVGGVIGGLATGVVAVIAWRRETKMTSKFPFGLAAACAWVGTTILAVGLDAAAYVGPNASRTSATARQADFAKLYHLFVSARKGDASAEEALKRWGAAGSSVAATLLGNLYDPTLNKASASAERTREAVTWYRKAANCDEVVAESDLGLLLVSARPGSPADPAEAARLFARAAPLDLAAARALAIMHQKGIGVSRDDGRALALLEDAADRGDLFSEKLLADVYDEGGLGTTARPAEAVRMLRLAVMHGDPQAERKLAEHLDAGRGTPAAPTEAAEWYARAASRGDAEAKSHLASSDPQGALRTPPWGATRQVIGRTSGDDAAAERSRCLEQRFSEPPTRVAHDLPASFEAQKPLSAELVRDFGRDARVRYARAAAMYDADQDEVAEVDLQCAVDDQATWYAFPYVQPFILTLLARIELDRGRRDDAGRIVAPVCASRHASIAALDLASLCGGRAESQGSVP